MRIKSTLLFVLIALAIVLGVILPVMDNDAAHHAVIALRMVETGDYITMTDVINQYTPYFDKPHLQFWLVAGSFDLMGVGGVVYKLSSLFFVLLSLFSTYKLGEYLVPRRGVGSVASLVLASMMAFLLGSSVDIRMDAIFSGAVIFAVWQGVVCIGQSKQKLKFGNYLGVALGLMLAFSCKGLYGVVIVGAALLFYMIGTKQLRWVISWRFLLALGLFGLFILPELWAFYQQFGWDGVSFMLYDQIMIRTGGGMGVAGQSDSFFFIHSLLWAVLPWSALLFYFAVKNMFAGKFEPIYWLTIPSTVIVIVMLSFSSFKLPHYLNPMFPLFAIFLAWELVQLRTRTRLIKGVAITQKVMVGIMIAGAVVLNYWVFAFDQVWLAVSFGLALLYFAVQLFGPWSSVEKIITMSVAVSALLWVGLNANFYAQLMEYQGGNVMAAKLNGRGIEPSQVFLYDVQDYSGSFDIHHGAIHKPLTMNEIVQKQNAGSKFYLYVEKAPYDKMKSDTLLNFKTLITLPDYRVSIMTPTFLNPATRASVIGSVYLLEFN